MSNPLNIFNNNQLFSNGPTQQPNQQQPQIYNPFLNSIGQGVAAQRFPSQQQQFPIQQQQFQNPPVNLFAPIQQQQSFQQPPNPFAQGQFNTPNPVQNGQIRNIFGVDLKANNQQGVGQNFLQQNNQQYGNVVNPFAPPNNNIVNPFAPLNNNIVNPFAPTNNIVNPFAPPTDQYQQSQQIFQQYQVPQYQRPYEYEYNRYGDPGQMVNDFLKTKNVPFERFKNFNNYVYIYYDDHLEDDISDLQWCKALNRFSFYATSSWDGMVRIYEVRQRSLSNDSCEMSFKSGFQFPVPVVSLAWSPDGNNIICSTTDNFIQLIDLHTQQQSQIAVHQDSIAQKVFISQQYGLVTVGFDKIIQFWDLRQQKPFLQLDCEDDITDACQDPNLDVMAFVDTGHYLKILDYDKLKGRYDNKTLFSSEYSKLGLHSPLTCVSLDMNCRQVLYGSVDGRVASNQINSRLEMKSELQFKCSNMKGEDQDRYISTVSLAGKVTAIQLYPIKANEQFVLTGSTDGRIVFWETSRRSKVGLIEFPQSQIVKAQISQDGKYVAFALGYTWNEGLWGANQAPNPYTGVIPLEDKQRTCQAIFR